MRVKKNRRLSAESAKTGDMVELAYIQQINIIIKDILKNILKILEDNAELMAILMEEFKFLKLELEKMNEKIEIIKAGDTSFL